MLSKIKTLAALILGAIMFSLPALAETGRDVMDRVYKQSDIFNQSEAEVMLTVVDKKGRERVRYFQSAVKRR